LIVPDINLLIYAFVEAFPQHARARAWWLDLMNGEDEIGLAPVTAFGFIRLTTNRRVLEQPMPLDRAVGHVRDWLDRPNVHVLVPGARHLDLALSLLAEVGTAGNLTTDVQLAAHAIENRAEVHSSDNDFDRFNRVNWTNPLA
jgi:hypothetical protein